MFTVWKWVNNLTDEQNLFLWNVQRRFLSGECHSQIRPCALSLIRSRDSVGRKRSVNSSPCSMTKQMGPSLHEDYRFTCKADAAPQLIGWPDQRPPILLCRRLVLVRSHKLRTGFSAPVSCRPYPVYAIFLAATESRVTGEGMWKLQCLSVAKCRALDWYSRRRFISIQDTDAYTWERQPSLMLACFSYLKKTHLCCIFTKSTFDVVFRWHANRVTFLHFAQQFFSIFHWIPSPIHQKWQKCVPFMQWEAWSELILESWF